MTGFADPGLLVKGRQPSKTCQFSENPEKNYLYPPLAWAVQTLIWLIIRLWFIMYFQENFPISNATFLTNIRKKDDESSNFKLTNTFLE